MNDQRCLGVARRTVAYDNDYARELFAAGYAKGMARVIIRILSHRKIAVPASVRDHIESCRDDDMFDTWIHRAVQAATIDDVFDE